MPRVALSVQLSIVNGVPQGFGVVEFRLHEDARKTKELLHGHCLNGNRLNILFTSPGVSAYKLYNRIIEEQVSLSLPPPSHGTRMPRTPFP